VYFGEAIGVLPTPRIRVPASSANVGPAFDALGLALTVYLEVSVGVADATVETHPAVRAFRYAGGTGPISVTAGFPGGRGLGYSGAARVAGLLAAHVQSGEGLLESRGTVLAQAIALEGHPDNVAASLLGGVVASAGGHATRIPLALEPAVVVWIPPRETATSTSRHRLAVSVSFDDAVFNIGRTALLVAALAAGDSGALRAATEDRLHQDARLARVPDSRAALRAAVAAGAWCAWLSGSGPSIAALADPADAQRIAAALPSSGRVIVLRIDDRGATIA